jgi:hypothetical protein
MKSDMYAIVHKYYAHTWLSFYGLFSQMILTMITIVSNQDFVSLIQGKLNKLIKRLKVKVIMESYCELYIMGCTNNPGYLLL